MSSDNHFRLPHSGLTVPHTRYAVTSYREVPTDRGVAFIATLRRDNEIIGVIENDGRGGPDHFVAVPDVNALEQHVALEAFAAQCTDAYEVTPTVEMLLGELVTEYHTTASIARAAQRGNVLLRLLEVDPADEGDDPAFWIPAALTVEARQEVAADPQRLRTYLHGLPGLEPNPLAWWQRWDDDAGLWIDVTDRPANVRPDNP